jgi:hypothetical protein
MSNPKEQGGFSHSQKDNKEPASSLNSLLTIIHSKLPRAISHPITTLDAFFDMGFLSVGNKKTTESFQNASITLPFSDISALSPDEFIVLKSAFQSLISDQYAATGLSIPPALQKLIDPNSKMNILEHESDHLRALPEPVKTTSQLIIIFTNDMYDAQIANDLAGLGLYNNTSLTLQEQLASLIAPQILSSLDIVSIRSTLEKINDPEATLQIETTIKEKSPEEN